MKYSIESLQEFNIIGVSREFHFPECFKEIPAFWDEYYKAGNGNVACGQFGICFDGKPDGTFRYAIGNQCTEEKTQDGKSLFHIFNRPDRIGIPEGFEIITVPTCTWMKVECLGPIPSSIQNAQKSIRTEWPEEYERVNGPDIEEYGYCACAEDSQKPDYQCFIWIPVRKKIRDLKFKTADEKDLPVVLNFIRELAKYEKMESSVVADESKLHKWMFEKKVAEAMIVSNADEPIGFAVYFYNFSTWLGRAGIYVEDVFVKPEYRGQGIGRKLFQKIARKAVSEGCGRMEWWCLKWNTPSLEFYRSLGAVQMDEWMPVRLTGKALTDLAEEDEK